MTESTPSNSEQAAQAIVSRDSNSLGVVTREMCRARARELAAIAGRPARQVWQADYLQAKRELTGVTDPDLQDAILDSTPYAGNWDPVSGITWGPTLSPFIAITPEKAGHFSDSAGD